MTCIDMINIYINASIIMAHLGWFAVVVWRKKKERKKLEHHLRIINMFSNYWSGSWWRLPREQGGISDWMGTMPTHTHLHLEAICRYQSTYWHVSGRLEKTGGPGWSPHRHGENMQSSTASPELCCSGATQRVSVNPNTTHTSLSITVMLLLTI